MTITAKIGWGAEKTKFQALHAYNDLGPLVMDTVNNNNTGDDMGKDVLIAPIRSDALRQLVESLSAEERRDLRAVLKDWTEMLNSCEIGDLSPRLAAPPRVSFRRDPLQ